MTKPSEILREAKAKIDTPEKWIQGTNAMRSGRRSTRYDDPLAVCFCSGAALLSVDISKSGLGTFGVAADYLRAEMGVISEFNDTNDHATVMAAWDRAIDAAERAEAMR